MAVLISAFGTPEHLYAPMHPTDHHSSFFKLTGLSSEEFNFSMEAAAFAVKCRKNYSDPFHEAAMSKCDNLTAQFNHLHVDWTGCLEEKILLLLQIKSYAAWNERLSSWIQATVAAGKWQ